MKKLAVVGLCLLFDVFTLNAQDQSLDTFVNRRKLSGFPAFYYTPETGFAFGALGLYNWNWQKDSLEAKSSSVTLGFAYTTRRQVLFYLPYSLFIRNDRIRLTGEFGFYKYVYFYFGRGNVPGTFEEKEEAFDVSFPRFRLSTLFKIRKNTFLGFRYAFDAYYDLQVEEKGKLDLEQPAGIRAGINSGAGPAFIYDTRTSVFYPRGGWLIDYSSTYDLGQVISDYRFSRNVLDVSYFYSPMKRSVLGLNINLQQNFGEVPFYQLSLLGGPRRLRGQFEGEFRDNLALQGQIEWRQEILNNWGMVAFIGLGSVASKYGQISWKNQKLGSGVGVRYKLNKKDHVNLRLDVGYGNGKIYPYITIGEAF